MPTHSAPGHPDCRIDCPAGGYAIYVKPYGPCEVGCDDPGSALVKVLKNDPAREMNFRIELAGSPAFLRLCRALGTLPISIEDRSVLSRAIRKISEQISPTRPVAIIPFLVSVHEKATVSVLIRDIETAAGPGDPFGGPGGGGQGPRPTPSQPTIRRVLAS